MTRFIKPTLTALALAAMAMPGQAVSQAQAKENVKATHGAWEVRCSAEQEDRCVMAQVGKTADGKVALEMRVRKLTDTKTQDGKTIPAAVQITTPLGSILRNGVRMKVDSGEPRAALYEVCVPTGCVVRDAVSEELLRSLKAGNTATLSFNMLQQGEITATVSLQGFTKAFNAL